MSMSGTSRSRTGYASLQLLQTMNMFFSTTSPLHLGQAKMFIRSFGTGIILSLSNWVYKFKVYKFRLDLSIGEKLNLNVSNKKTKLAGGFTRNITLSEINGIPVVIKSYPRPIRTTFIDFSKSTFSIFFMKPRISFLSREDRILREVLGHEKMKEIEIAVPKILEFSFDDHYIAEEYIAGENLYNVIKNSEKSERENLSRKIGEITGRLHSLGFAFFDNRPQNYISKDGAIFRIDLETFEFEPTMFEKYCDVVSFTESFTGEIRKEVHDSFISGYEKYENHTHNMFIENLARRALLLLNLNRPRFRVGSFFNKNPISSYSNSFASLKHFITVHLRKPKSN